MITVNTHQDSLEKWRAVIDDSEGNTIASLPANGYGYETKTQAEEAAEKWLNSRSHLDIEGGGVRHITPHKGGRTIKRSTDVTPETNERLRLLAEHGISLGDLIEEAATAIAAADTDNWTVERLDAEPVAPIVATWEDGALAVTLTSARQPAAGVAARRYLGLTW